MILANRGSVLGLDARIDMLANGNNLGNPLSAVGEGRQMPRQVPLISSLTLFRTAALSEPSLRSNGAR